MGCLSRTLLCWRLLAADAEIATVDVSVLSFGEEATYHNLNSKEVERPAKVCAMLFYISG